MQFDKKDIDNIARLAKLSVATDDIPEYARELSNIFSLVEQMNQVNTDDINPLAHPLELSARMREDIVTESNERDYFQSVAPRVANGYYLVPRVIE